MNGTGATALVGGWSRNCKFYDGLGFGMGVGFVAFEIGGHTMLVQKQYNTRVLSPFSIDEK